MDEILPIPSKINNLSQENILKWLPFIITGLTAIGYLCAYTFELGACLNDQIPFALISISINQIIKFVIIVSIPFFFIFSQNILGMPDFGPETYKRNIQFAVNLLGISTLIISILIAIFFFEKDNPNNYSFFVLPATFAMVAPYLGPWINRKEVDSIKSKYGKDASRVISQLRFELLLEELRSFKTYFIGIYVILIVTFFIGWAFVDFGPSSYINGTKMRFLKKYDELMIFRKYDTVKHRLDGAILIKKISDSNQLELIPE